MLGPILFSLLINDVKPVSSSSLLVKYDDDITVSIPRPVRAEDRSIPELEVNSIMKWAEKNQITLNLSKTWEMLLKSPKIPPPPLAIVERKTQLKLLGVTSEADPMKWDTHIDHVLSKVNSRLYILRVCKFYATLRSN